jgi:hypothetical protein
MNQDREENRIKELFHELKKEDAHSAPSFARIMEAARLRTVEPRHPWRILTIAVATVMLVLVGSSLFIIRQLSTKPQPIERADMEEPIVESPPPDVITAGPDKNEALNKNEAPKTVRRRVTNRPKHAATLISGWRSPTDFLLKISGEQLLRTTPRLGESIVNIEGFFLEEKN